MKKLIFSIAILLSSLSLFYNINSFDNVDHSNDKITSLQIVKNLAFAESECGDCENIDCDSGGQGSTQCSVGDWSGNCSTTCSDPCYACCDNDRILCRCCPTS